MSARIGVWDRATAWGREVHRRDVWDPQETGAGDEERLPKCPAAELGMSLEDRIWEDRESNTDLVFVTTNFSPPAIIKSLWSLANHSSLAPGEKNHRFSKKKKNKVHE